jgi:calretinin
LSFCTPQISGNGYIEGTELDGFLKEFVSSANASDVSPEVSTKIFLTLSINKEIMKCFK